MSELQIQTLTGEDLLSISANNADKRYELIEGELIEMPPTGLVDGKHEFRVAKLIDRFVEEHNLGTVMTGEVGYYIRGHDKTVRAADVAFASYERMPKDETPSNYGKIAPELVVEIVSPNDAATKIAEKSQRVA
jgi:Uma2 family endonuclease